MLFSYLKYIVKNKIIKEIYVSRRRERKVETMHKRTVSIIRAKN